MRTYLSTLHQRSDSHKKLFALAASGTFTFLIFGFWFLATFPPQGRQSLAAEGSEGLVSVVPGAANVEATPSNEFSPSQSALSSLAESWGAIQGAFGELKNALGGTSFREGYADMKDHAFDVYNYGQNEQ